MYDELAQGAWAVFKADNQVPDIDIVYMRQAFQQGYIRFWLNLAREMVQYNVGNMTVVKAAVAASNAFTASENFDYLSDGQLYARRVLWKNDNINFSAQWARDAWTDVQLAALLRQDVREALIEQLKPSMNLEQPE
jgi:hypothetical protein